MKSDIDRLMEETGLDALLVIGPADHNPAMVYFTGLAHVSHATLLKKRAQDPILFYASMEREEAARSGLRIKDQDDYDLIELLKQAGGDRVQADALWYGRMVREFEVRGRVGLHGRVEVGPAVATFRKVEQALPEIEFIGDSEDRSVLARARATKDADEVERIRQMGQTTVAVAGEVATFLTSHQVKDGLLLNREGNPLTVGEVKRRINLWLAMRGAENPEGTIFAIGRDAGIPHSAGNDQDLIPIGKPIVFDLYPCEKGGGYFYDFTRTWCVGHAPDEVLSAYHDVLEVFEAIQTTMKPDTLCREYQRWTCERFEAKGHPTVKSNPKTQKGYVHTLGHGLGLAVHESPFFADLEGNTDRLLPGAVFTVEPGLYYPERALGVRIEDTIWMRPDGTVETLAEFPKDLVLKA